MIQMANKYSPCAIKKSVYIPYEKLVNCSNISSATPSKKYKDQCLYCGDIMLPEAKYDNTKNAWVASLVCSNVECGASSPRKWARKKKKAINAVMNTCMSSFDAEKDLNIKAQFMELSKAAERTTSSIDEIASSYKSFSFRNSHNTEIIGEWIR